MVYEAKKQLMAWIEKDYSNRMHFRWNIKWRLSFEWSLFEVSFDSSGLRSPLVFVQFTFSTRVRTVLKSPWIWLLVLKSSWICIKPWKVLDLWQKYENFIWQFCLRSPPSWAVCVLIFKPWDYALPCAVPAEGVPFSLAVTFLLYKLDKCVSTKNMAEPTSVIFSPRKIKHCPWKVLEFWFDIKLYKPWALKV